MDGEIGRRRFFFDADVETFVAERQRRRELIEAGELDFAIGSVDAVDDLVSAQHAGERARVLLTVAAATLVVVLAGFGFYGTQRYLASAGRAASSPSAPRSAPGRALGRTVLALAFALGLPGLALGVLLAFVLGAWMRGDFVSNAGGAAVRSARFQLARPFSSRAQPRSVYHDGGGSPPSLASSSLATASGLSSSSAKPTSSAS